MLGRPWAPNLYNAQKSSKAVQPLLIFHFYITFYCLYNHLCKIIIINIILDDDESTTYLSNYV